MDSFLFAIGAVSPIILMTVIGYLLKRAGFITETLAKALNKLVFRVFLPVMLFLNVYKIEDAEKVDLGYIVYVLLAQILIFLVSIPLVMLVTKKCERRGVLLQATFRSNYALIGIPLAGALFGDSGLLVATLLSAAVIPLYNILAVISLSVFREGGEKPSVKKIILGILKNPLIISIAMGMLTLLVRLLFVRWNITFRLSDIAPVFTALNYLSSLATPLALLVLGAQFEFSAISSLKKEIVFGTVMRTAVAPVLGIGIAYLFFGGDFGGAHFAAFVSVFATPVAVSSVPMAQEMDADVALAGQLVVWTTLASAFSVFLASMALRALEIF